MNTFEQKFFHKTQICFPNDIENQIFSDNQIKGLNVALLTLIFQWLPIQHA